MTTITPVILCGGSGTRLWPLSRSGFPKQFLCLTGNESLFQQAAQRLMGLTAPSINVAPPIIVTGEEHRFLVAEQLREAGIPLGAVLLEPVGRNTAPALTFAALAAIQNGQDPILVVTPADQTVANLAAFTQAMDRAIAQAEQGSIVILGITPNHPETGYGYIQVPVAIFAGRNNLMALAGVLLTVVLMFYLLLAEHVDHLVAGYITDQMASSGSAIRIAMNAVPAAVFLVFRQRFNLTDAQRIFWTWMSLGGLAFIGLLAVSPSSTAVDRVALYWIPLQLYVWSRWPEAMARTHNAQLPWLAGVLLYSLAVQFVWLFYADHSHLWVPYQFYPWVWLWQ